MQMKNGLACAAAVVENGAIAGEKVAVLGQLGGDKLQFTEERLVGVRSIVQSREMLARANQDVRRGLGIDVLEGKDLVIFVHNL